MNYDKNSGIYAIKNIENDKLYIGQAYNIDKRINTHISAMKGGYEDCGYLQNAWNKYGGDSFLFYIIELCSSDKLDEKEIYWIKYLHSHVSENGYNLSFGGEHPMKGRNHREYSRAKMSEKRKLRVTTDDTKKKISKSLQSNTRARGFKNITATSIYIGVHLIKEKYWIAHICFEGENIYLGSYKTEIEAAQVYNLKAIELLGKDTRLNNV